MLGLTRNVLAMQRISRFILKEDQDVFYLNLKKLIITSEPQECDLRIQRDDDTIFWARIETSLVNSSDESPTFRVVMIDITARKRTEEALFRSEAHFKLLAETAEQLIVWEDVEVTIGELCRKTMEHLDCDVFLNFLIDLETRRLHLKGFAGITDEQASSIEWLEFEESICGSVALNYQPIVAENILASPDTLNELARSFGLKAHACFPMTAQGKLIGTLAFVREIEPVSLRKISRLLRPLQHIWLPPCSAQSSLMKYRERMIAWSQRFRRGRSNLKKLLRH